MAETGTFRVKRGLAEMLKGGVIMDVTTAEAARIAEQTGAVAVMALERVPADIRADGGVARMASPRVIKEIQDTVTIPVMAKARIGHFAEAQVLQALEVDYIDESEVLTPADEANHIDKHEFEIPFVCGATDLGEALRRIGEGAAMIRSKGEAGTGNIVEAVRHLRHIVGGIKRLGTLREEIPGAAEGAAGADRRGRGGGPQRLAARAALLCRRNRDPSRCGADDAAGRRGQLRRLGHLQVRGPRAPRPRHRRGDDALQRPGAGRGRLERARGRCAATTSPSLPPRGSSCSSAVPSVGSPEAGASRGGNRPPARRRAGQPG